MVDQIIGSSRDVQTVDSDHSALYAACEHSVGLCTIVGIEGSFSRRLGAQMAVHPDGTVTGDLSDGCLEQQLANDVLAATAPKMKRYGRGSPIMDFRLPCGGGLDILVNPTPDRQACRAVVNLLERRSPASLELAKNSYMTRRHYLPSLRLNVFGEGAEMRALKTLAAATCVQTTIHQKTSGLMRGQIDGSQLDPYTAVLLLFHDHQWEIPILREALRSPAFYIGAQGGANARARRNEALLEAGLSDEQLARIRSPIGVVAGSRTPTTLALSVLCEIVSSYERLQMNA